KGLEADEQQSCVLLETGQLAWRASHLA
ncbi:hypothetical protein A2U01_0110740, partial [Trifolium medium]|nr:hypothetical protein [Trifolium medium]